MGNKQTNWFIDNLQEKEAINSQDGLHLHIP